MDRIVKVEHPGHEGAEVKLKGKHLHDVRGVQIKGGSGAGSGGVKIRTSRDKQERDA